MIFFIHKNQYWINRANTEHLKALDTNLLWNARTYNILNDNFNSRTCKIYYHFERNDCTILVLIFRFVADDKTLYDVQHNIARQASWLRICIMLWEAFHPTFKDSSRIQICCRKKAAQFLIDFCIYYKIFPRFRTLKYPRTFSICS